MESASFHDCRFDYYTVVYNTITEETLSKYCQGSSTLYCGQIMNVSVIYKISYIYLHNL